MVIDALPQLFDAGTERVDNLFFSTLFKLAPLENVGLA